MRFKTFYIQEQEFNFDLSQIDELESFKDRINFVKEKLKYLGQGSSRTVFELTPKWVLKIARNDKGINQNKTEADAELQKQYPDIVPNIKDESKKLNWIVVERGQKITPTKFKLLTGISLALFGEGLKEIHKLENGNLKSLSKDVEEELDKNNSFLNIVKDFMITFNMLPGDLIKISSWGEVNGKVKLLDPGLTQDTYDQLYRK